MKKLITITWAGLFSAACGMPTNQTQYTPVHYNTPTDTVTIPDETNPIDEENLVDETDVTNDEGDIEEENIDLTIGGPSTGEPNDRGIGDDNAETDIENDTDTVIGGGGANLEYISNDDLVTGSMTGRMHNSDMVESNELTVTGVMGSDVQILGTTTNPYRPQSMVRMEGATWDWLNVTASTTFQVNFVSTQDHVVEIGGEMMSVYLCTGQGIGAWQADTTPGQGGGGGGECEVTPTPGTESGLMVANVNCVFNSDNGGGEVEVNFYKAM